MKIEEEKRKERVEKWKESYNKKFVIRPFKWLWQLIINKK